MDDTRLKEILSVADREAKGWETNRKGTTENGIRYVREDIAHAAMRAAYKAGWDDQCDVVSACLV